MSQQDFNDALTALFTWFESQGIEPRDAAHMCATVCGILAKTDEQIADLIRTVHEAHGQSRTS